MSKADERTRIMLDATPLCCNYWDENHRNIDCNQEAVNLFGLKNKQEYLDRFFDLSPEFQPNGKRSRDQAREYIDQAFATGRVQFEWIHQKLDGEPIPAEVTLVRVKRKEGDVVISFTRDLRELRATQANAREANSANERSRIMLDATPLSCTFWDANANPVDCNQEAVHLFGLMSKQEYLDRFFDLSPEIQPCGKPSREIGRGYFKTAIETGRVRFEWMHQKLNGEKIPSEVTLVRVKQEDGYGVIGYSRDLRELKATLSEKQEADERTRIMFESMPLCCSLWDKDARPIDCNQETLDLYGLKDKKEYLERFHELSPVRQPCGRLSLDMFVEYNQQAFYSGRINFEWMHQTLSGEPIPVEVTLVFAKRGKGDFIASYVRDLRELKASLAEMREADERTRIMLDATPLCCNFWDENFNNIDCNQEAVNLFELKDKQEYLDRFFDLSPKFQPCGRLTSEKALDYIKEAFATGRARFEWMHQKLNGEPVPAEITLVRVKRGDKFIVAGYTRDLRELKDTVNVVNRLEKLAFTDNLTGVFNRHYFKEHVAQEFLKHLGDQAPSCIIMFDIDHFKRVNDTYGHSAGDIILRGVAQKVLAVLRSSDLLARYGGEEFIIYAAKAPLSAATRLAERIREAVAESTFTYEGKEIKVTISLGVADQSMAGTSFEKFVVLADEALYKAKNSGRNRVECAETMLSGDAPTPSPR